MLDILAPKSDAAAYNPPGTEKGDKPKITKLAANNAITAAQASAIADTAAKLKSDVPPSQAADQAADTNNAVVQLRHRQHNCDRSSSLQ